MNLKKRLCLWIFLLLSIGFIFFNSSQSSLESNARSFEIAKKVVTKIQNNPNFDNVLNVIVCNIARLENYDLNGVIDTVGMVNILIRKLAHGFEFFLLGLVLNFTFYMMKLRKINIVIYSLFLVLLSASCDEFFQLFIKGRTSTVTDILIDFIGGVIACTAFFVVMAIYAKLKKVKSKPLYK